MDERNDMSQPENINTGANTTPTTDDAADANGGQPLVTPTTNPSDPQMNERLERLGGEPAPVITPEEFARLQKAGQVHIDARGRVRTSRRTSDADAGVSLRKRRAWYAYA
ncbi:MAG: hypothetical protein SF029_00430 [bacterium]|nr:hypothetical protein [bacterium]